jgi:hypothetical protein
VPVGGVAPGFAAEIVTVTVIVCPAVGVVVDAETTVVVVLGCTLIVTGCEFPDW